MYKRSQQIAAELSSLLFDMGRPRFLRRQFWRFQYKTRIRQAIFSKNTGYISSMTLPGNNTRGSEMDRMASQRSGVAWLARAQVATLWLSVWRREPLNGVSGLTSWRPPAATLSIWWIRQRYQMWWRWRLSICGSTTRGVATYALLVARRRLSSCYLLRAATRLSKWWRGATMCLGNGCSTATTSSEWWGSDLDEVRHWLKAHC